MGIIACVWVREGNEATLRDWPLNKPVLLVSGSTVVAREYRKTARSEHVGFGRVLYTQWEVWGAIQTSA